MGIGSIRAVAAGTALVLVSLVLPWQHNDVDGYTSGITSLFGDSADPAAAALVVLGALVALPTLLAARRRWWLAGAVGAVVGLAGAGLAAALIADDTTIAFGVESASGQFWEQWVDSTPSYGVFLYAGALLGLLIWYVRRLTRRPSLS
jgi:hypothetical protein